MDSAKLDRMAELAVGFGANVQPGQRVMVIAAVGQEELARKIVERAYQAGAVYVDMIYRDPYVQRARLVYGGDDALGYEPEWIVEMLRQHGIHQGAQIALSGPTEPGLLDGIDPERIGRDRPPGRVQGIENMTQARNNWTIVPYPTIGWARQVHPGCPTRTRSPASPSRSCTSAAWTRRTRWQPGRSARTSSSRPPSA